MSEDRINNTPMLTATGAQLAPRELTEEEKAHEQEYLASRAEALNTLKEIMKDANVETAYRLQAAQLLLGNYF